MASPPQSSSREEQMLEVMGEYLAAFLAVEQDWGVIDGLMRARSLEEALEHYDAALRAVHRVLEEYGGLIHYNVSRILGEEKVVLAQIIDEASRLVRRKLEEQNSRRSTALKLVERALAKYPKYAKREERGETP